MSLPNSVSSSISETKDIELGNHGHYVKVSTIGNALITNPTFDYFQKEDKLHGFLSQQFPTTANPAPLGLGSFALTTLVLSLYNAGGVRSIHAPPGVVMGLAMFYGGLCQLLAGMWEFKTGNTFGALAFSSYGGFWMSYAALFNQDYGFLNSYTSESDLNNDIGIYLMAWSMFSLWMTLASHRTTVALTTLFFLVFLTFLMLSIHSFSGEILCQEAGGCFGVMAAFLAWYCSYAGLLTRKTSFITLPVGEWDPIYRSWGWLPPLPEEQGVEGKATD